MSSNVNIKLKKKQYDSSVDDAAGVLTFDTVTKEIYIEGDRYGHFTTMDATGTIDSSSTDQQFPTARSVYNYVLAGLDDNVNYATAYANSLIEQGVVTPIPTVPSMLYAPEVITNTTDTTCTLDPMKGNAVYIFTQPLTRLDILSIAALNLETTIYFTTHSTSDFSYSFPQGMYKMSMLAFEKGKHYCLSIKDGLVILEKIERFLNESTFIYSSEQLVDGALKSSPTIVEITGSTPVVNTTQPYTIYKFGQITSLTMQQVPSNTLETICYFSAGSTPVNLVLSGISPLKLSAGSVTNLTNGSFCLVIKDGVIVITEIKEI
jgi:hypothetical protein